MHVKTFTTEDTDKLMSLFRAKTTLDAIKHILNNKRSHADQIKAIKKELA